MPRGFTGRETRIIDVRSESERKSAIAHAVELLDRGELVGLPTETVYGIAANAGRPEAIDKLWEAHRAIGEGGDSRSLLAWHLAGADALAKLAPHRSGVHRRLVERLAPGPVTFAVALTPEEANQLSERHNAVRDVFEDGTQALFRCPTPEVTRRVLALARAPVVMISAMIQGRPARTAEEAAAALRTRGPASNAGELPVGILLDDGTRALGRQSTLVRLTMDGGYLVAREGAIEERYIDKQLSMTIVFVCTGNTCRSPMAAAIARHALVDADLGGLTITVKSAGMSAGEGSPATPEAAEAVRRLGMEMGSHASAPLTRDLVAQADLIFGMTRSHVDSARSMAPSASGRIHTLDPEGRDIPDPIGMSQEVYDQTAQAILAAVERRLAAIRTSSES